MAGRSADQITEWEGGSLGELVSMLQAAALPVRHRSDCVRRGQQQRRRGASSSGWNGRRLCREPAPGRRHGGTATSGRRALRRGKQASQPRDRVAERAWPASRQLERPPARGADALLRGLCPDLPVGSVARSRPRRDQLPTWRDHRHGRWWQRGLGSIARGDGMGGWFVRDHSARAGAAAVAVVA